MDKFIEIIGQYQPRFGGDIALNLQLDRVNYWLDVGAEPSDTVRSLLRRGGVLKTRHEARLGEKLKSAAVAVPSDAEPRGLTVLHAEPKRRRDDLVIVGRVRRAHGVRGALAVESLIDYAGCDLRVRRCHLCGRPPWQRPATMVSCTLSMGDQ